MSNETSSTLRKLYRLADLPPIVGLRKSQILELVKTGEFPAPIQLSDTGRALAWFEDDLIRWQNVREARREANQKARAEATAAARAAAKAKRQQS